MSNATARFSTLVLALTTTVGAFAAPQKKPVDVTMTGVTNMRAAAVQKLAPANNTFGFTFAPDFPKPSFGTLAPAKKLATSDLIVKTLPITGSTAFGFDALDTRDAGLASGFVNEPPDQALGVSNTQVVEGVNDAFAVYNTHGDIIAGPVSFENFFHTPPSTPNNQIQLSDPRVHYDWQTGRWFVLILQYAFDSQGNFVPGSNVLVAVSQSNDAAGNYTRYAVNVSDSGYPGCPCLGDQPLLGINQDGVFISTNNYSTSTGFFKTAFIVALDKLSMVAGATGVTGVGFDNLAQAEGPGFSVHPAVSAPGTSTSKNKGTEYFVSSLDFNNTIDNRLTVWAMTDTSALREFGKSLGLHQQVINVETYGAPPPVVQRPGPTPLADSLGQPEQVIDSGDDRMEQVYFSNGKLVCGVTTVVYDALMNARAGIAWFALKPSASSTSVSASVANQGYVAVDVDSVIYPSAALSTGGSHGVIGFSLAGPDYFPSTAYVHFANASVGGSVHISGAGAAPEDGFSAYLFGRPRWGDYSAAAISPNSHSWSAAEYITARQRTHYTNWGTFITKSD